MAPENDAGCETVSLALSQARIQADPFLALPALLSWIRDKRWFMDKEAAITGLEKADSVVLAPGPDPAVHGLFVTFRLAGTFLETQKRYFIPIILSSSRIPDVAAADTMRLALTDGALYWSLAEHSTLYQQIWLRHLAAGSVLTTQRSGCIRFEALAPLRPGPLQARPLDVSTSNVLTLVDVEEAAKPTHWISKTYKDLRGPSGHPDRQWPANYEAVRYEALALAHYPNIPPLHGLIFYTDPAGLVSALGAVMDAVDKEDEVGSIFWQGLGRYLEAWQRGQVRPGASFHQQHRHGAAAAAREIARTIAGMHAAFLAGPAASFRPAAASPEELQQWSEAPLLNIEAALSALRAHQAARPDRGLAVLIQQLEPLSPHFAPAGPAGEETRLQQVARLLREQCQGLMKTQIHGDLHPAQGLIAAAPGGRVLDRFFAAVARGADDEAQQAARELASRIRWIDFEGVPAKTLADPAEDGRDSPFLDLAGIIQGFWYIANLHGYGHLGLNPQENPGHRTAARQASLALAGEMTPREAAVPGLTADLIELINGWLTTVTSAFLDGYLEEMDALGLGESLLTPWDRDKARTLIYFWVLARAAHELRYETYARDWGWEAIAGARILQILRTCDFAAALAAPAPPQEFRGSEDFVQVAMPAPAFFSPVDAARLVDGVFLPLHHIRSADDWGIGDFATAWKAVDFCRAMGFHFMQFLPVTYSAAYHSPYSVASSRALDPEYASVPALLRDLEPAGVRAAEAFIREQAAVLEALRRRDWIDHDQIKQLKLAALRRIWEIFRQRPDARLYREFQDFLERHRSWLPDHMLFLELKQELIQRDPAVGWDWRTWDRFEPGLSSRKPSALARARRRHAGNVLFASFVQFVLDRQFRELVDYGRQHQVFLMVDMPFSPPDADIWINPGLVGLRKENGFQRRETQGVPAKRENPVGQNWQFTAYDWTNPATVEFFLDIFRISQERAVYVRVDHVLGIYRTYLFRQDVDERLTLEKLGLYEPIQAIRQRALQANTDAAKQEAVREVGALLERRLADPAGGLPPDVIQALFNETGNVRRGGNMIAIARKAPPEQHDEPLPADSLWQRWTQTEDLIFKNQPVWDYIRLTPNERANDEGFLYQYLFPDEGTDPPLPTDDLRPAYYRLAPAEKILAELLRLAQEQGTILILETLGTVPDEIEHSTRRLGGYNYLPVIWGLDRGSRYHPVHFIRNAYATFGVADSESLYAAWRNARPEVKWTLLREFFPGAADHELERHAASLTPEVHEKLLLMVYAPRAIYPEIAPDNVPLMAVTGLHDIAGYSDDYRLNRPGESGQWSIRFPEEVAIDQLLASALGYAATEKAGQVVQLFRRLQQARQRQAPSGEPDAARLLRVRPDVQSRVLQIRGLGGHPDQAKPFYIEASVQGQPARVELVVTNGDDREIRFAMQPVAVQTGGVAGVTWWGVALQPGRVGNYHFQVTMTRADGAVEVSQTGYLSAVPSGVDLNPLSPDYFLESEAYCK